MQLGSIYLIENKVNGKVYVGQTLQSVKKRFEQHLKLLKSNQCQAVSRAIRKYGKENFSCIVLEADIPEDLLDSKEEFYIREYNSISQGYNLCPGGQAWRRKPKELPAADIVALYESGESSRTIAKKYNVCHATVLMVVRKTCDPRIKNCRLPDRSSRISKETLVDLYINQGLTQETVANLLEVSLRTVQRAVKRHNLRRT